MTCDDPKHDGRPANNKLLTVIITTSPTPSAPSTELLGAIFESYKSHCPFLLDCRVIVVFDSYDHVNTSARLKKGQVTLQQAEDYEAYKFHVKQLVLSSFSTAAAADEPTELQQGHDVAEFGLPRLPAKDVLLTTWHTTDQAVSFIEPSKRLGFGLAVRSALRMTRTPYVFVQQHDWTLTATVPILPLLDIMQSSSESNSSIPIKYVCLPAIRMLNYATSAHVLEFPTLRDLTTKLRRSFSPPSQPETLIPLTPLFFWHDKPHVASTHHYLQRVFPTRLAMLRGDFIEDKIGQRARQTMKEGQWAKWACWLYYPDEGRTACVKHLQGRTWRGEEGQREQVARYQEMNRRAKNEEGGELGVGVAVGGNGSADGEEEEEGGERPGEEEVQS